VIVKPVVYSTARMASLDGVWSVPKLEEQRAALQAVLASTTFARNPRLALLLEYLCVRCFKGEASFIKEYNIATDVFRRPPEFDQSGDSIVRVEMHRLRKKLKEYYAGEGASQSIQIVIQSGQYQPEFVCRYNPEQLNVDSVAPVPELASAWTSVPAIEPPKRRKSISRQALGFIIAVGALLLLAALAGLTYFGLHRASRPPSGAGFEQHVPAIIPVGFSVRILCGSSRSGLQDHEGNAWSGDMFSSGGIARDLPPQPIYRTRDPLLFRSARFGEFSYKIPVKPGIYELRLYFADTSFSPGPAMEGGENLRVFNVSMNGSSLLQHFDVIADSGPSCADIRVFKDVQPAADGYVHLSFSKDTETPLLNAIEIVPGIPHRIHPIRIVTQDATVTDRSGMPWSPDNYFLGGRIIGRQGAVDGPYDPDIYARERYGNFSYAIPVADGHYTVSLHFAETYWGPDGQGGGGAGSRLFDVYCNGTALLRKFDMYKEAGPHRQIVKTFRGLQPNGQGKLLLSFVPIKNYASISAIEIIDEGK
jgi:Malectin domain